MFPSSKIFLIGERVYRLCTVTNTGIVNILPVHELRLGLGLGFHLPCILVFTLLAIGTHGYMPSAKFVFHLGLQN